MTGFTPYFELHVTTWENDADHYGTKILNCDSEEEVAFWVELAKRFKSKNSSAKGLGNDEVSTVELKGLVQGMLMKHPHVPDHVRELFVEDECIYEALADRLLGYAQDECYGGNFCRVFSTFKVLYITAPKEDVTSKFE